MLGGYGVLGKGAEVEKTFGPLAPHTQLRVTLDFFKIDSWDLENAYLYIDGQLVWDSGPMDCYSRDGQAIVSQAHCGGSHSCEARIPVDVVVAHSASTATLRMTASLSGSATDESWGIQSVQLSVRLPSPPPQPPAPPPGQPPALPPATPWTAWDDCSEAELSGDFNGNGEFSLTDALAVAHMWSWRIPVTACMGGDFNQDERFSLADAAFVAAVWSGRKHFPWHE